jgi:glycosyltransferase involved in cell wall biosynthesis
MDDAWTLAPEMRLVARVSDAARRVRTPQAADGWVHLLGGYGRIVRSRYVTLFDMSPSQLLSFAADSPATFGYPDAKPHQMAWVARRQEGVYRHAHACCVPSRWAADSLIRDHGIAARRVHVVGYGRNVEVPPPEDRDWSTPRFLFIGWDWKRKNGDAVVRSFARLRSDIPTARLDVVGNHPPLDIEGVQGHGSIPFYETSGRALILGLFATATCFVLPSLCEPFGIVYVEAATAGLASIATTIGGTAESVGDGGVLVNPYDDDDIYRAMRELSDPENALALGMVARQRAEAFTWPRCSQRVVRSLDLGFRGVDLADFL